MADPLDYLRGFAVTFRKLFEPRVTGDYRGGMAPAGKPDEKRAKPARLHGRHVLNRYDDGMEKCIGCELCAGVCPANCIYVRGADNDPENPTAPGERFGWVYEINYLRCIHCDLCVEACPTQAITETKLFEFSFTDRNDAVYTKDELLVDDDGRPRKLRWEDWREGEDELTSGWMRATSPSGDHRYEGMVQWASELGYGVRAPEAGQAAGHADGRPGQDDPGGLDGRPATLSDPAHSHPDPSGHPEPSDPDPQAHHAQADPEPNSSPREPQESPS